MGPIQHRGSTTSALAVDVVRAAARAFERDRYLAALLAPAAVRADLIALAAFAGELARIPAYVSDPIVGEMRLQWWRDTLAAGLAGDRVAGDGVAGVVGSGEGSGHPIAVAVIAAARRHDIPAAAFQDVIEAQSERLEDQPFATFEALVANARAWDGGLFAIAAGMLVGALQPLQNGVADDSRMAGDAGAAYGLARVLLETPVDLTQGRCLLPADVCSRHGATLGVAFEPGTLAAFDSARREVVAAATVRLGNLGERYQRAPRGSRVAALPLALVQPYLSLCRSTDMAGGWHRDVGPLTRVWRLWLTHRLGRIAN